jgi:hypothetical protein
MIRLSLNALTALARGAKPQYKVKAYFQQPEEYTVADYLESVGPINASLSNEGGYSVANTTITLRDTYRHFSKKFAKELPVRKVIEVYILIAGEAYLKFRGAVGGWSKDRPLVTLDLNASLLDEIRLRSSAVYRNPREIVPLQVVVGDLTNSHIPCLALDKDGKTHHASDLPMQSITEVCVDGEPRTWGFKAYPAWQDETGRSIAAVIFDEPQYDKKVSVRGKGAMKLDTGELIELPPDLIRLVLVDIQGNSADVLDAGELSAFYSLCLKSEVRVATLLRGKKILKEFFDELALNIHAHWLISDGKSVMRQRGVADSSPVRHSFGPEMESPKTTSEDLFNELTVNYGFDFAEGKYLSSLTKHNPLSKVIYGRSEKTLDLSMIQSTRQAENTCDAALRTYSIPQLIHSFKDDSRTCHLEPGDRVDLTDPDGIGENGFDEAAGIITAQSLSDGAIDYTVALEGDSELYRSELVNLTQAVGATKENLLITYENGVATLTIVNESGAGIEGVEATISGVRKVTDKSGQVRFKLLPGTYTVNLTAAAYNDVKYTFTV